MAPGNTPKRLPQKRKIGGKNATPSSRSAKTPEPAKSKKNLPTPLRKTPKSAPQAKRKKLAQELDEQISDEEFELGLEDVRATEKRKKLTGTLTPKKPEFDDDSEEDDDFEDDEDDDSEEEEDDEDDSDDDDDDDDEEMDESAMADILKKLTKNSGAEEDDSDDEEEESDEDDDDSMDSDDDDEEMPLPKPTAKKAPKKTKQKDKKKAPPPEKRPQVDDKYLLIVKNIPLHATKDSVQKMCRQAKSIHLHELFNVDKENKSQIAYITYETEEIVSKEHKRLQGKVMDSKELIVDFAGAKSAHLKSKAPAPDEADLTKLYLRNFARDMNKSKIKKAFPSAIDIHCPVRRDGKAQGYAFVKFKTKPECKKAMSEIMDKNCLGSGVVAMYAKKRTEKKQPQQEKSNKKDAQVKKAKFTEKQEVELEEEEEDEEDESDEEDGEEMDEDESDEDDESEDDDESD